METIGFIGLGIMGKPMALHLLEAGYPLIVNNRTRRAADELSARGARRMDSAQDIAAASDIVITMLPDPVVVREVIGGKEGVLAGARRGSIVVDMSSSLPTLARELAAAGRLRGVMVADAPVSGGEIGARQASLSIMVGADTEVLPRLLPVLGHLGKNIVHVGGPGAGQVVKAANQVIVGLTIEAVAEALAMTARAGVDPAKAREAMLGGFASSRILELHGRRMVERDFAPGARMTVQEKDLGIALELAEAYGLELPVTRQVRAMYQELIRRGLGDQDHSALFRFFE